MLLQIPAIYNLGVCTLYTYISVFSLHPLCHQSTTESERVPGELPPCEPISLVVGAGARPGESSSRGPVLQAALAKCPGTDTAKCGACCTDLWWGPPRSESTGRSTLS